jgi:hypothetical protein
MLSQLQILYSKGWTVKDSDNSSHDLFWSNVPYSGQSWLGVQLETSQMQGLRAISNTTAYSSSLIDQQIFLRSNYSVIIVIIPLA